MRYGSVCSGMEAASVAWHPLGWTPAFFSEIEPFPCAILSTRFPHTPNHGSLTEYKSWPVERGAIDLLVGGTPCQSFSVAGLRKGLDDPRGNLALVFLGLADKLKPRWIVWENVPGVLSSAGGRDFGSFLGALVELGYGFAYRVLDAQHFGVPQRRRRVFVVACLGDWRAPAEVLSLREGLRGYLEAGGKKRKGVAADAGSGVEANGLQRTVGTLCADTHPGAYSGQDAYTGRLIPDQKPVVIDRAAFNQGQNAQYEPHIEETEVMDSLVARGPHAVGQPIPFRKSKRAASTTDNETWVPADVTNTLNNFDLGDTRTTHAVVNAGFMIREDSKNDTFHAKPVDVSLCVTALQPSPQSQHAQNFIVQSCAVAPTVTSSGPPYSRTGNERVEAGAEPSTTTTTTLKASAGDQTPHVAIPPMAVRRLTPVECERLQGFPDNWSRIPWKGKPETECPDGPRYKACGNSMAVPVMRWIGERIHNYELSQNHEAK